MFYAGDLQAAIALALHDSKPVTCFVRDDGEESTLWEKAYLSDPQVSKTLKEKAITLRIQAQSEEAIHLSAYFELHIIPTIIVIYNGQLLLSLRSGLRLHEFKKAILGALDPPEPDTPEKSSSNEVSNHTNVEGEASGAQFAPPFADSSSSSVPATPNSPIAQIDDDNSSMDHSILPASSSNSSSTPTVQENSQSALAEVMKLRRQRLEADKAAKDAAEKERQRAAVEARKEITNTPAPGSTTAKKALHARELCKRQQEAKIERNRILKEIENDRAARREKDEQRRALAKAEAVQKLEAGSNADIELFKTTKAPDTASSANCALKVRLFDGSTIRANFAQHQTLGTDVRNWIADQESNRDIPFTFKRILTPLPNRAITISEEEEAMGSLGFMPSATLIMVPVQDYTMAYDSGQGIVGKFVAVGGGLIKGAFETLLALGRMMPSAQAAGPEGAQEPQGKPQQGAGTSAARPRPNFRAISSRQDNEEHHQLYNGNQLNFEPRREEDGMQ